MGQINTLIAQIKESLIESAIHIGVALVIIIVFVLLSGLCSYILVRLFNLREKDKKQIKKNGFYLPLKFFFIALGFYLGLSIVPMPSNVWVIITKIFKIFIIALIANGFVNIFNPNSRTYKRAKEKFNFKGNDTVIYFISRLAKVLIYIVAVFIIISELGYNIGGLVTGLGISSVVIALAAQDFAKSIFAGFSILSDKPFEIGDYIESKEFAGTVVDITFRTTRLRDVHNQVVIIPNNRIIDSFIINGSRKEKRRFNLSLTLVLSTSLEKVAALNEKLRSSLLAHPDVIKDSVRVTFDNISINGIDILITCYADIVDTNKFSKFKEELNYTILGIIQEENVRLAYQSQTLYVKHAD